MTKKNKRIFKKKGNVVKDLTRNIFKVLNEDSEKFYNHKQIAAKLKISDTDGKNQIIKKLAELTATKQIKEVERGKFQVNVDRKYSIGTLDVTSNGNGILLQMIMKTIFLSQILILERVTSRYSESICL